MAEAQTVAILVAPMYEDTELWYPYYRLREAGHTPELIASQATTFESKHGYPATADVAVNGLESGGYAGVVIPGGFGPDFLRRDTNMLNFVRAINDRGGLVAAICHAGWLLVSADIANGRRLTSFSSIRDDLVNAGAEWVDEEVVIDNNLITARMPADLPAFGKAIVEWIAAQ